MSSLADGGDCVEEDTVSILFRSFFIFYNVNFDVSFHTRRLHELVSNLPLRIRYFSHCQMLTRLPLKSWNVKLLNPPVRNSFSVS